MKRKSVVVVTAITVIGAAVVLFSLLANRDQPYDRAFDSQVDDPAYRTDGPIVLFDEGHLNTHTTTAGYKPLADLLRNDGYRLRVLQQPLSLPELEGVSIVVLALARGANDANDDPAYSEAEGVVIDKWVRSGGSLLLITDHWPYGSAASSLARSFTGPKKAITSLQPGVQAQGGETQSAEGCRGPGSRRCPGNSPVYAVAVAEGSP